MQATNIVSITPDGIGLLDTMGQATYMQGGRTKTRLLTHHKVHYTEKREAGVITCRHAHTSDVTMKTIKNFKGTITFETDSGKTMKMANAFVEGDPTLQTGDESSGFDLVFVGDPATEE